MFVSLCRCLSSPISPRLILRVYWFRICVYVVAFPHGSPCASFFLSQQKTAYEMRISDWSSDVCSSDLPGTVRQELLIAGAHAEHDALRRSHLLLRKIAEISGGKRAAEGADKARRMVPLAMEAALDRHTDTGARLDRDEIGGHGFGAGRALCQARADDGRLPPSRSVDDGDARRIVAVEAVDPGADDEPGISPRHGHPHAAHKPCVTPH